MPLGFTSILAAFVLLVFDKLFHPFLKDICEGISTIRYSCLLLLQHYKGLILLYAIIKQSTIIDEKNIRENVWDVLESDLPSHADWTERLAFRWTHHLKNKPEVIIVK